MTAILRIALFLASVASIGWPSRSFAEDKPPLEGPTPALEPDARTDVRKKAGDPPALDALFEKGKGFVKKDLVWEAEKAFKKCMEQAEGLPAEDVRRVQVMTELGKLWTYMGKPAEGYALVKHAYELHRKIAGEESKEFMDTRAAMTVAHLRLGRYAEAIQEADKIRELARTFYGEDSLAEANALHLKEGAYFYMNRLDLAEEVCRTAIEQYVRRLGEKAPQTLERRKALVRLQLRQGKFVEAESAIPAQLKSMEEVFGTDAFQIADAKKLWVEPYISAGRYDEATALLDDAIRIYRTNPKWVGALAWCLNQRAQIADERGDAETLRRALEEALAAWRKVRAPPRIRETLQRLGAVYRDEAAYDKAEAMLLEALALDRKYYGADSSSDLDLVEELGWVYLRSNRLEEAEKQFARAFEGYAEHLGGADGQWATFARNERAVAVACQGRKAEALEMFRKSFHALETTRAGIFGGSKREYKIWWMHRNRWEWEVPIQLALELKGAKDAPADGSAWAFEAALSLQGAVGQAMASEWRGAYTQQDEQVRKAAEDLAAARRIYAGYLLKGDTNKRKELETAGARVAGLEKDLAQRSERFARWQNAQHADSAAVQAALPEDAALVTVIQFTHRDFAGQLKRGDSHYAAFVVRRGHRVYLADLGAAAEIDAAALQLAKALAPGAAEADWRPAAQAVSGRLLGPLWSELKDSRSWIFAFDGALCAMPVHILPPPEQGGAAFVLDGHEVSYLNSARDLITGAAAAEPDPATAPKSAAIFADPDFSAKLAPSGVELASASRSPGLERRVWAPLPHTRVEGQALAELLNGKRFEVALSTGAKASKEALLRLPPVGILHIATHGFYLPDRVAGAPAVKSGEAPEAGRGLAGITNVEAAPERGLQDLAKFDNPLLRSGLVFAGANADDGLVRGIVTAEELTGMNLWHTKLVVLSACETGLGGVTAGEGLVGLRSSILQSGARTLVSSLWKVPDRETMDLMRAFYRRIAEGKPKGAALREAMQEVRESRIKAGGDANPFYWGAFVLIGDPGAM